MIGHLYLFIFSTTKYLLEEKSQENHFPLQMTLSTVFYAYLHKLLCDEAFREGIKIAFLYLGCCLFMVRESLGYCVLSQN